MSFCSCRAESGHGVEDFLDARFILLCMDLQIKEAGAATAFKKESGRNTVASFSDELRSTPLAQRPVIAWLTFIRTPLLYHSQAQFCRVQPESAHA